MQRARNCVFNFSNRQIGRDEANSYIPDEDRWREVVVHDCHTLGDVRTVIHHGEETFQHHILAGYVPTDVLAYYGNVPVIPHQFSLTQDVMEITFKMSPWRGSRNRFTGVWQAEADNIPLPNGRSLMSIVVFGRDTLNCQDNAVDAIHDIGRRVMSPIHYGPNFVAVESFALGSIISDVIDNGYEIYVAGGGSAAIEDMMLQRAILRRNDGHADAVFEFLWHGVVVGPLILQGNVRPFDTTSTIHCRPHTRWNEFAGRPPQAGEVWTVVFAGTFGEGNHHRYVLPVKLLNG